MTTGERVKALRKARGWSQDRLAKVSGYSRGHIGGAERGSEGNEILWTSLALALGVNRITLMSDAATETACKAVRS